MKFGPPIDLFEWLIQLVVSEPKSSDREMLLLPVLIGALFIMVVVSVLAVILYFVVGIFGNLLAAILAIVVIAFFIGLVTWGMSRLHERDASVGRLIRTSKKTRQKSGKKFMDEIESWVPDAQQSPAR